MEEKEVVTIESLKKNRTYKHLFIPPSLLDRLFGKRLKDVIALPVLPEGSLILESPRYDPVYNCWIFLVGHPSWEVVKEGDRILMVESDMKAYKLESIDG